MAPWILYLLFGTLAFISVWIVTTELIRQYNIFKRTHIVTCPETGRSAAVTVDPWKAALPAAFGSPSALQVTDCSRWDHDCGCDQRCRDQIALAPEDTLFRSILAKRYASRTCMHCQRLFLGNANQPIPAVFGGDRTLVDVMEIPPERLEEIIDTHLPLCARCYGVAVLRPGDKAFFASSRRIGTL